MRVRADAPCNHRARGPAALLDYRIGTILYNVALYWPHTHAAHSGRVIAILRVMRHVSIRCVMRVCVLY